ncbi:radical SAM family heme chaperone HemW [Nitrosospira multiformis]|uniref:Heme chaperone HemW n=1 Tax=Nitrosospira multiformis (strain ATCC 25196 / NCIMB 11849 / C 71) TaxID=323848 RepID=Q2YCZ4_NITMU|nr:radical SAM family heme chaperone HemW [Nitrosospira multiformis]ABB73377.1 coproporphyrinogen III oxidase, anaerobic [Nitrosospira multiformis ATCC 25196]SEA72255.1 oxygen-independent coproporphyrinogen-3 oxidase [Nitrosospira multiformis]SEG17093.1 oxygen-independent coproporphyrinogen-3 oxidase [Nitrosospira multiformis ATCC 25196]
MTAIISPAAILGSQTLQLKSLPPLSLYIHIPWCMKKCPYCDFNSYEVRDRSGGMPEAEYVAALIRDLEASLPQIWGRKVISIFFGGGTPSLFSPHSIDGILAAVRALLPLEHLAEITLEANPGTFEAQRFADFQAAGINRLSIGIQSFNARHLASLGRIHDGKDARRAIEIAQKNFDNINLDLMYGLPNQTLEEAREDIETAIAHGVQHISAYHLALEPNTLFHRYPPSLPDDELTADMQAMIEQTLAREGYANYETSAFARPGRESRHNMNYWLFGDYLGIGAGAHSKISFRDRIVRQMRYRQPKEYLIKSVPEMASEPPVMEQHEVGRNDRAFEFVMNALRLTDGFAPQMFIERTGLALTHIQRQLDEAERRQLITRDFQRIAPTFAGRRFLNDLLQIFLPGQSRV